VSGLGEECGGDGEREKNRGPIQFLHNCATTENNKQKTRNTKYFTACRIFDTL